MNNLGFTIIHEGIDPAELNPVEREILYHLFDGEDRDGRQFLSLDSSPTVLVSCSLTDLKQAIAATDAAFHGSRAYTFATKTVAEKEKHCRGDLTELDFRTDDTWIVVLQELIARSATLKYLTISIGDCESDNHQIEFLAITANRVVRRTLRDIQAQLFADLKNAGEDVGPKPNTLFSYMYRDAANYKTVRDVVMAGPLSEPQIRAINNRADEKRYFVPSAIGLDDLQGQHGKWDEEIDHGFHELGLLEPTDRKPTIELTAGQFLQNFLEMEDWEKAAVEASIKYAD